MLQVMERPCRDPKRRSRQHARRFDILSLVSLVRYGFFFISRYRQSAHVVPVSNAPKLAAVIFPSIFKDVVRWAFLFVRPFLHAWEHFQGMRSCPGWARKIDDVDGVSNKNDLYRAHVLISKYISGLMVWNRASVWRCWKWLGKRFR